MPTDTAPPAPKPEHSPLADAQGIAFGATMAATGVMLLTHLGLVTGQTAGLAVLISYVTGWSFGAVFFVVNLPFYWFGWRRMGLEFTLKTFAAVALLSVISALLQEVDPNLEEHHIDEYMVRGLKHPFTDSNELVDVGEFVANLQRKLLHRRGHYVTDLDVSKLAHLVPANYLDIITELKANSASAAPVSLSGWDDKSMRSHRSSIWG